MLRRERGGPPLWVSLRWNANPPQADAQKVAGLLVELVEQRLSTIPAGIHVMTDIEPNEVPDELAHYVHGLVVVRTRNDDHWVSGFVNYPDVTPQELQQEIDRKTSSGHRILD